MFIYNVKVNGSKCFKIILVILGLVVVVFFALSIYRVFFSDNGIIRVNDSIEHSNVTEIDAKNYTNILKATHDDIDSYVGKEFKFSGYVYRVLDFNDNQFVLARDMLVDSQAFVVGFLCEYDNITEFDDGSWIEIVGVITKGKYHNQDMPIVKVKSLNEIQKPKDCFVSPPEDTYIPTSSML